MPENRTQAAAIGVLVRTASSLFRKAGAAKSPAIKARAVKSAVALYRAAATALSKISNKLRRVRGKNTGLEKRLAPQLAKLRKIKRQQYYRVRSLTGKKGPQYNQARKSMGLKPSPATLQQPSMPSHPSMPSPTLTKVSKVSEPGKQSKLGKAAKIAKKVADAPGVDIVTDIGKGLLIDKAIDVAVEHTKKSKESKPTNNKATDKSKKGTVEAKAKAKLSTEIKLRATKEITKLDLEIKRQKSVVKKITKKLLDLESNCRKLQKRNDNKKLIPLRHQLYVLSGKKAAETMVLRNLQITHSQLVKRLDLHKQAI